MPANIDSRCFFAVRLYKRLYKACHEYDAWKAAQPRPNYKPWLYPEQSALPRLDWDKVGPFSELLIGRTNSSRELLDEANAIDSEAGSLHSHDSEQTASYSTEDFDLDTPL